MIKQTQIDLINKELGHIPEILYHGRYEYPNTIEEILKGLKIFEDVQQIYNIQDNELKKYGRTYLDSAFHGFYLTPCLGQAIRWSLTKPHKKHKTYQIIKMRRIKEVSDLNIRINIVPDLEWVEHVILNRGKLIQYNPYDIVYNYIADGYMTLIANEIKDKNNYDKKELHKKLLDNRKEFLRIYYNNYNYSLREIIDSLKLNEYKNYQVCISSNRALKYFEIDDIMELPNNYLEINNLNDSLDISRHIKKKYGYNLINECIFDKIKERCE